MALKRVITTPLYYVNDKPHLGSAYTTLAGDTIARFYRLQGDNVIFITGVDEHGQKIQRTAESKGIKPQEHCDEIVNTYYTLWEKWDITNDRFIRTSDNDHHKLVIEFFKKVEASGDIKLDRQQGWYCVGCEEYKEVNDDSKTPKCNIHLRELEWRDEENLFFKLSKYQSVIEELIADNIALLPENRRNEIVNFVKGGLKDFSISRVNLDWGIPVPGYEGHTFYVWFDALVGYLTALINNTSIEEPLDQLTEYGWPSITHIIGKDILRFHTVYWPAMLLSAGLKPPARVFGHGFITREGQKMGKSLGNVLDPELLIEKVGINAVRWYLLKDLNFGADGDFQVKRLVDIVNNDLANTIGNLLNRTITMSRNWFSNRVPSYDIEPLQSREIEKYVNSKIKAYIDNMSRLNIQAACNEILDIATFANGYLNDNYPWKKIKDPTNKNEVAYQIYNVLESTRIIGILLSPILPQLSKNILSQLGYMNSFKHWDIHLDWGTLSQGSLLNPPSPIISKLEDIIL